MFSSVPTQNDIAVPETVLKKQKASQKANDSKAADLQKKREVSLHIPLPFNTSW